MGDILWENKQYILIGTSFIPVVGDIQGFVEAQTTGDYVFATIGLVPGLGDLAQKAHKAKKAYDAAKSINNVQGMKNAIQQGVDVLKQGKGMQGVPAVSQPIPGSQAVRQVESGQAVPVGYSRDSQGRLHDHQGRYVSDPNSPRVSTNLNRPSLRADTKTKILANYRKLPNGDYMDNITGDIIKAPIDIGHAYGREHRRLKILAHEFHLTQSQFNDFINAHPEYFRLENMSSNRSHSGEMPGNAIPSQLRQDMINFCKKHQCGVKK